MLEKGQVAMLELARDYKRQQAIIEKNGYEDTSLRSSSQLTQSLPTKQELKRQPQLQQLHGLQKSLGQQVRLVSSSR